MKETLRARRPLGSVVLLALVVAALAFGAGFASTSASEEAPREIVVTMHNFHFDPHTITVAPGENVRFVVKNPSAMPHTFTIYRAPDNRQSPLANVSVAPQGEQVVQLTMPSEEMELYLVCLPHERGLNMHGTIVVKNPEY